jgi:hypothetical protein
VSLAQQIQELHRQRLSQREIARRLGCSKGLVWKHRLDAPSGLKGGHSLEKFPVHPAVEEAKAELLAAVLSGGDIGQARQKLKRLLNQHHPRDTRHPMQLEHGK